jgi:hypothetical protein
MEQAKALVDKILSNQITAFLFTLGSAIGLTMGIAGGFWVLYKTVIFLGAY